MAHISLSPGQEFILGLIIFGPALLGLIFLVVGFVKLGKKTSCKPWFIAAGVAAVLEALWLFFLTGRF